MRKDSCGLGSGSLLNFHRLGENLNLNEMSKVYLPCFGDRWVTTIYILLGGFPWGSNHKNVAIIILHILDFKMTGCTHVRRWCELINSVPFTYCAKVTWRCPTWAQTVLDKQKENPSWVFFFLHFCSLLPAGVWCNVENLIYGTSTIWIANSCLSIGINNLSSWIFALKRAIGKKWMNLFSLWVWVVFHYAHKTHWKLYPPINGRKLVLILGYLY